MAFFDIPRPEELTPEVRRWFDELKRLRGVEAPPSSTLVYGRSPKIVEARVRAEANLVPKSGPSGFSFSTRQVAFMLIAHARRCQGCFGSARTQLTALGFDEPALDGFCANPAALPLPDRDRLFVQYTLRIAMNPAELQPKDLRELEAHGFSREDVQEMIGFAAFAVFHTIFTTMANTALNDE
jgi:alkylhydroperoxidase family enzyme